MYERQIFPIFLMWETDLWSTLKNIFTDTMAKQPRTTGAVMDQRKETGGTPAWSGSARFPERECGAR